MGDAHCAKKMNQLEMDAIIERLKIWELIITKTKMLQ
jgi:hypothetical protein